MSHKPKSHDETTIRGGSEPRATSTTTFATPTIPSRGHVRPCARVPGKFEVVFPDGSVLAYAFRTETEARAALGEK